MRGLLFSLALVVTFVVLFWGAGQALGYEVALTSSVLLSVLLTLVLNLVLSTFRHRG